MSFSKWIDPRSPRFCVKCLKETRFIFCEKEGHSLCEFCHGRDAVAPDNKRVIGWLYHAYWKGRDAELRRLDKEKNRGET